MRYVIVREDLILTTGTIAGGKLNNWLVLSHFISKHNHYHIYDAYYYDNYYLAEAYLIGQKEILFANYQYKYWFQEHSDILNSSKIISEEELENQLMIKNIIE